MNALLIISSFAGGTCGGIHAALGRLFSQPRTCRLQPKLPQSRRN
jgi:hypothetical protein